MRDMTLDVHAQLKALRLNGMAIAWGELVEQGGETALDASRWLVEHLLQAEDADRAMRSTAHQMKAARFPIHRDLAGFDFEVSQVDRALITPSECASIPPWIWSMRWSRRKPKARRAALP